MKMSTIAVVALIFSIPSLGRAQQPAAATLAVMNLANTDTNHFLFLGDIDSTNDNKLPLPSRLMKTKGNTIRVVYDSCQVTTVEVVETARKSRLRDDISLLLGDLLDKMSRTSECRLEHKDYTLRHKRAKLKVVGKASDGTVVESIDIVTGPTENFYLGLDLPVDDGDALKYDSDSKSLKPKDSEPQLYLSLNFLTGDVMSDPATFSAFEKVSFKALMRASDRPLDSVGVGLGYRLPAFDFLGLDVSSISIFGGHFWTKQDDIVDGQPKTNGSTSAQWRLGVSYDLSTGLTWVGW